MTNVSHLSIDSSYSSLNEAFPQADCGHKALGERVIVQIRTPKEKSKGGVYLVDDAKDAEQWNTQVGKVIDIGPLAFKNRSTGVPWPEGAWAVVGDFVRVPKYGGDRWQVKFGSKADDKALFVILRDVDLVAKVVDPLSVQTFV